MRTYLPVVIIVTCNRCHEYVLDKLPGISPDKFVMMLNRLLFLQVQQHELATEFLRAPSDSPLGTHNIIVMRAALLTHGVYDGVC